MENDAEIFPAHYTWTVVEKGFKMASMMNKLVMINSCEIFLKNKCFLFAKNHYEIQMCTILVGTLYSIKYGNCNAILELGCEKLPVLSTKSTFQMYSGR
jgi:predicted Zn-dependent protease